MGMKSMGRRQSARPIRKAPIPRGVPGPVRGPVPQGCPGEVAIVGSAARQPAVGQAASLTLAAGRPQLVVGGRVASIVSTRPSLDVLTRCLELGETYGGTVTGASGEQFEARLTRGG